MKDKKQILTIDDYINIFPENMQVVLKQIRDTIREVLPEAKEKIAYGIPTFEVNGINLVSFGGWKQHISLYPIPAGNKEFQGRIKQYRKAKSTMQFPLKNTISYELIAEAVTFLKKEKIK